MDDGRGASAFDQAYEGHWPRWEGALDVAQAQEAFVQLAHIHPAYVFLFVHPFCFFVLTTSCSHAVCHLEQWLIPTGNGLLAEELQQET